MSEQLNAVTAPSDHQAAVDLIEQIDGGILRRGGVRSSLDRLDWVSSAATTDRRALTGAGTPGMRLLGAASGENVRAALLDWTQSTGGSPSTTRTPVFWLPPMLPGWGRSVPFVNLARDLSTAHQLDDGTVLLARSKSHDEDRNWAKLYGAAGNLLPLFDRCLAVPASEIPHALEVLIKPGAWAVVLIHSPDVNSRYPFPFGYITADPSIVEPYKHLIAELAAKAEGTRAVLWTKSGEDAHRALASIDTALGISVA